MFHNKKAQVTIFIILAILIVVGIVSYFSIKNFSDVDSKKTTDGVLSYAKSSIDECLKDKSIFAINTYGLNEILIDEYVENEIVSCVDGYLSKYVEDENINYSLEKVDVLLNDKSLSINMIFPIYLEKDGNVAEIRNFDFVFDLFYSENLKTDSDCVLTEDSSIFSSNDRFSINVNRGTVAKDYDGNCLNEITLNIVDTIKYGGDRSTGISSLMYLPGPAGAEFSYPVSLELKYSDEDYESYIVASFEKKKFFELEKNLKIKHFDKTTNDYYIYSSVNDFWNMNSSKDGFIIAKTNLFYGKSFPTNSDCSLRKDVILESSNNRVNLILKNGTIIKKSDGSCLDKIDIKIEPRRSNVVTFGDYEYLFEPKGTEFDKSITYVYNYNLADVSDPRFLYGRNNWQDLITKNWSVPKMQYTDYGFISPVKERVPEDLSIAYYDNDRKIYIPWDTNVDKKNKRVVAEIEHFSSIIPAQGCRDWNYFHFPNVAVVAKDANGNCTGDDISAKFQLKVVEENSCINTSYSGVSIYAAVSAGDSGELEEGLIEGGDGTSWIGNALNIKTYVKDIDKSISDRGVCAYEDVYIKYRGIGMNPSGYTGTPAEIESASFCSIFNCVNGTEDDDVVVLGAGMGSGGAGGCDKSLESGCSEKDLCNRCWKDMFYGGVSCSSSPANAGWHCSKTRLDGCVRDNCHGGGEEEGGEEGSSGSVLSGPVSSGQQVVISTSANGNYSIKQIAKFPHYLWFMATVGNRMYSGVYSSPQYFYYSDSPFTTWNPVQIGSGDESTRVYNLNNRFYATSEGGNKGGGGKVYADSSVCYDFPSGTSYVLGAEYHDNKYLISRNKGDKTDIYSCSCSGGQTCSLWKSVDGIFTFHMTSYKGDLYLIGTGSKYRTGDGGKVKIIRSDGRVDELIGSGPGSGVRARVFDNKIFFGFAYDAEVWSYDGSTKKQEKTFPGIDHFGDFEIFDDKLFTVVVNEGGNPEVWYRNNNSKGGNWVKVFNFNQLAGYGVSGNLVNAAGFFTKYNDSLYLNINTPNGGRGGSGYILEISKASVVVDNVLNINSLGYNKSSCFVFPTSAWGSVAPSSVGLDESKLVALKNSVGGRGAVFYKGNKVYSWGDGSAKGDVASASKPILSLILFYSLANGKIPGVDKKLSDYRGSCAGGITFHHVANMISGYALGESAGAKWAYNDRGIALYATTLFDKVWKSSAQSVFNSIFAPLNFQDSPSMNTGSKSGRITISVDDFARIGLFVSCKGNWNGNQIIPENYFNLIKNQVPNSLPASTKSSDCDSDSCSIGTFGGGCNQNANGRGRYGYNFWVFNEEYNQGQVIPSDTIILIGHAGAENMIIIPSLDIVAVGFGNWGDTSDDSSTGFRKNVRYLVDAVAG